MSSFSREFIAQSFFRMEENNERIEKCLAMLTEEEVWKKPNQSSNSIGNLILHLCGNIRQYITSSLGNIEDNRKRDLEFSTTKGFTKKELLKKIISTVEEANNTLKNLKEADFPNILPRSLRGQYSHSC